MNPHLQQQQQTQQNYFARQHKAKGLPSPPELAQRVEEAKTSAKLLTQLTQSTPPSEILSNDLIKEFSDRCASASRSMQNYISANDPAPDQDTLLTLIETNDALAAAMSRHQRSVLQARKVASPSPTPAETQQSGPQGGAGGGIFTGAPPAPLSQQNLQAHTHPQSQSQQPHNIFSRASEHLRLSNPTSRTKNQKSYDAPSPLALSNGNGIGKEKDREKDPFADTNEVAPPRGMQQPLVPLNYGLPPDSVPVPGSPTGNAGGAPWDSSADTRDHSGVEGVSRAQVGHGVGTGSVGFGSAVGVGGEGSTGKGKETAAWDRREEGYSGWGSVTGPAPNLQTKPNADVVAPRGEPPILGQPQAPKQKYRF